MGVRSERRTMDPTGYNYLLMSDVHLGAGLVTHARPWAGGFQHRCTEVDGSIATCLDHYDGHRPGGKPWRLIVAGDFVDFIGMSLPPPEGEALPSGVTDEERAHGLGSAADHAVHKLRAAAELHHVAFAAIARFVASGNELIVVRGNHDVDFHWPEVQRAFVDLLHEHGPAHIRRSTLRKRARFCPWFYYAKGLVYVEHGHEFDPMCSYGDPLSPVCPRDPRRIRRTPSDVMLRYVARPTPGLSTTQHEQGTVASYLKLVASLGLGGGVRLVWRFVRATCTLVRDSVYDHRHLGALSSSPTRLSRLLRYARRLRVDEATVRAMVELYATPAGLRPLTLAGRLYLDRFLMLSAALWLCMLAVTVAGSNWGAGCFVLAVALALVSTKTRNRAEDPAEAMQAGAARIAELFPAKFVVMGHTHQPVVEPIGCHVTYVNLGHWGQDDLPEDLPRHVTPPCSHLVLLTEPGGVRGELRRWDRVHGPVPFVPPRPEPESDTAPGAAPALC